MKLTKAIWFKNLCLLVAFLLFYQTILPTAHYLPMSKISLEFGPAAAYAQEPEDDLLRPTPDADTTDPYVLDKAAELGHDPTRIFQFVRDEIGYESYKGSLRGARGTLWTKAGNALDQASLLVALLRTSGIPARYVHGTLDTAQAQQLILSMFPPILRVVGCVPADAERADPANDPRLLEETKEHYWVEFDDGSGFRAADPTFTGAEIGNTFATAESRFAEVPDNLRHKVTVRLKAELRSSFPNIPLEIKTPLNVTFNTVELVGRPLSIGHFVNSFSPPSLVFGTVTHTYSPYILIGQIDGDISDDPIIRGEDYQEYLTNFPMGSQFLTGLFLEIDVITPGRGTETYERTLIDRIGFVNRQNGSPIELSMTSGQQPAISPFDTVTISVESGLSNPEALCVLLNEGQDLQNYAADLFELLQEADPESLDATEQELLDRMLEVDQNIMRILTQLSALIFTNLSHIVVQQMTTIGLVKSYLDTPRIIVASNRATNVDDRVSLQLSIDLCKDNIRAVPSTGQVKDMLSRFYLVIGLLESTVESEVVEILDVHDEDFYTEPYSIARVFEAAENQGAYLVTLGKENASLVNMLNLSEEARIRIQQAISQGKLIVVPQGNVQVGEMQTVSWFEYDPDTGVIKDVAENGEHTALTEWTHFAEVAYETAKLLKQATSVTYTILERVPHIMNLVAELSMDETAFKQEISTIANTMLKRVLEALEAALDRDAKKRYAALVALPDLMLACNLTGSLFQVLHLVDPPANGIMFGIPGDLPPVTPGEQPGVNVQIVQDELLSVQLDGVDIPSTFRVQIQNTGPTEDTFSVAISQEPPGFTTCLSLSEVTVPPGETAEVGISLYPLEGIDPPGSFFPFAINVTSTTDPTITKVANAQFVMPELDQITIATDLPFTSATPGSSLPLTLTLTSVGNVPSDGIALEVDTSAGLVLSGLTSPLSLGIGQSISQDLTLDISETAPLNSLLWATIRATFATSSGQTKTVSTRVCIQVVAPAAQSAADAALAAGQAGRPQLGSTLNELGMVMTELGQEMGNEYFQGRTVALLESLIEQLNGPALAPYKDDFTALRDDIADATTPEEIQDALNNLSNLFLSLVNILSTVEAYPFEVALSPNSAVALPETPTRFDIYIRNTGSQTTTYNLSMSTMPPNVTCELNRTSVSLAPGESIPSTDGPNAYVTITQAEEELQAFDFSVTVSIADRPDIARTAHGAFTVRQELVEVVEVKADPTFASPGDQVHILARILNAVNKNRLVRVSYVVKNPTGAIIFTSVPEEVELTALSSLDTVDLGILDTTDFESGNHTLEVTVADLDGQPIPGAVGQGSLLIGLPITAEMAVTPEAVPPCQETVTTTLDISSLVDFSDQQFVLLDQVDTDGIAASVAIKDNLAYVCGSENIAIIDISDPTDAQIVNTFADNLINISGVFKSFCRIIDNHLVVMWQQQFGSDPFQILVYDLADPLQPTLITNTSANFHFLGDLFFNGNTGFVTMRGVYFWLWVILTDQVGDFLSFDFNDMENPRFLDALFGTRVDPDTGQLEMGSGDFNVWQAAAVNDNIILVATTTSEGSNPSGYGRILVVDTSNPASLEILKEVQIPNTVHATGIGIQGNLALVVGNTGGWSGRILPPLYPLWRLSGNVTLTALDITDPLNPVVIGTIETNGRAGIDNTDTTVDTRSDTTVTPMGDGFFAVSGIALDDEPVLMVVDATDPQNLSFITLAVPGIIEEVNIQDNLLFVPSSAGLSIYDLSGMIGARVTAQVIIPKGNGLELVPGSFNIEPVEIISGDEFDTLVWEFLLGAEGTSKTLTWQSTVNNMQPGEARDITLGATIDFTMPSGDSGQIELPAMKVLSEQILTLDPHTQTVLPGGNAEYTLTVKNPTESALTYNLSVQGVPQDWVDIVPSVAVPAHGTGEIVLTLRSDPSAIESENGFVVTARADTCPTGFVHGSLILEGSFLGEDVESVTRGVVLSITPSQATAGQATSAEYVVRITNTGSMTDNFSLSVASPAGFSSSLDQQVVEVPPGINNFREVLLTVSPPQGAPPGIQVFTVTAVSTTDTSVSGQGSGMVTVVQNGVNVVLNPASGVAGSTFQLTVINTGQVEDTFDLTLGGPAGVISTLETESVTLAPGTSQEVTITIGAIDFAFPGALDLVAIATSRGNTAITDSATAHVIIEATQGIGVSFDPAVVELAAPGSAAFLLTVHNTGNTEDAYTAEVTEISGPVTANFDGLYGQATQTISTFRLPGLATGIILLNASLDAYGEGTVTVGVTSLSNPLVHASATALLRAGEAPPPNCPPVANAGPDENMKTGTGVTLDASNSFDPDGDIITFEWSLESKPPNSTLADLDIWGRTTPNPSITPDMDGIYVFKLVVSDGRLESEPDYVEIRATIPNVPPNAYAGEDQTAYIGNGVTLNGRGSNDPDDGPGFLAYLWTFKELPAKSTLEDGDIIDADQVQANFIPDAVGTYVLNLRVYDGEDSDDDEMVVTASYRNVPPNANAGEDKNISLGDEVVLDGTSSNDPDDGPEELSFIWTFVFLPDESILTNGDIIDADTVTPRFRPDVAGTYILRLEVFDGEKKDFDNVMISVSSAPTCLLCDLDCDSDVDRDDIDIILTYRNQPSTECPDCDIDGDGTITVLDARKCVLRCTRPRCATE